MRQKISLHQSVFEIVQIMSEKNPGAMDVLSRTIQAEKSLFPIKTILDLDDMNIRGYQIWLGYKDFCNADIAEFISKVNSRDQGLVDFINKYPGAKEMAVSSGASFQR